MRVCQNMFVPDPVDKAPLSMCPGQAIAMAPGPLARPVSLRAAFKHTRAGAMESHGLGPQYYLNVCNLNVMDDSMGVSHASRVEHCLITSG